jgi:hypothetical protein
MAQKVPGESGDQPFQQPLIGNLLESNVHESIHQIFILDRKLKEERN